MKRILFFPIYFFSVLLLYAGNEKRFYKIEDAFDLELSNYFGIDSLKRSLNSSSFYKYATTPEDLLFDVGNNRIFVSAAYDGKIRSACVLDEKKVFRGSSSLGLEILIDDLPPSQTYRSTRLIEDYFPLFRFRYDSIYVDQVLFCPMSDNSDEDRPSAVFICYKVENRGKQKRKVLFSIPSEIPPIERTNETNALASPDEEFPARFPEQNKSKGRFSPAFQAIQYYTGYPLQNIQLNPGDTEYVWLALIVSESLESLRKNAEALSARTPDQWFDQTLRAYRRCFGKLSIPEAPYYAEALRRMALSAKHSMLWSENQLQSNDDGSHAIVSMIDPGAVRNYMKGSAAWLMSQDPYHSVYNCFYGLPVSGGEYYQFTGDTAYFAANPQFLANLEESVSDLFAYSKHSDKMLFYAQQIWDSLARGDWHFGSNVYLWYTFKQWAQIIRFAYKNEKLATRWSSYAEKMGQDINLFMVKDNRFYEGVNSNGSVIMGHDGEEGASTLAPYYGFCNPDDPRLLTYKKTAFTIENPLYYPPLHGIEWLDCRNHDAPYSGWRAGITMPSYATGLCSASDEEEVAYWLNRFAEVTDADGSLWWWPYRYNEKDKKNVARRDVSQQGAKIQVGKTGWAASLYAVLFYTKVIGLQFDYPRKTIAFEPLSPYDFFSWQDCRMGNSFFDLHLSREENTRMARIVNKNPEEFTYRIKLQLPPNWGQAVTCNLNGTAVTPHQGRHYAEKAYWVTGKIAPGDSVSFEIATQNSALLPVKSQESAVSVRPGSLLVKNESSSPVTLKLYRLPGLLCFEQICTTGNSVYSLPDLEPGIYLYTLQEDSRLLIRGKLYYPGKR